LPEFPGIRVPGLSDAQRQTNLEMLPLGKAEL
jgi:hypothetical protein